MVIPAGATSAPINITPIDDTTPEPSETVILTLSANAAYTLGTPTSGTITIADNDTGGILDNTGLAPKVPLMGHFGDKDQHIAVDGVKKLDWTDPNARYASGYVAPQVWNADASYDDFALVKYPTPLPVVTDDGVFTSNLSSLHASWTIADTTQTGFQYSISKSAGAADVVPWTPTTATNVTRALTMMPGTTPPQPGPRCPPPG